jgi:hypothetical protein
MVQNEKRSLNNLATLPSTTLYKDSALNKIFSKSWPRINTIVYEP